MSCTSHAMDRHKQPVFATCAFVLSLLLPCTSFLSFFERQTAWRTNISHSWLPDSTLATAASKNAFVSSKFSHHAPHIHTTETANTPRTTSLTSRFICLSCCHGCCGGYAALVSPCLSVNEDSHIKMRRRPRLTASTPSLPCPSHATPALPSPLTHPQLQQQYPSYACRGTARRPGGVSPDRKGFCSPPPSACILLLLLLLLLLLPADRLPHHTTASPSALLRPSHAPGRDEGKEQ